MKLLEFIKYLTNPEKLVELYKELGIDLESEALLIYYQGVLDLDTDIYIFEIEETEDNLVFEKEGINYIQLFPVDYAIELIESDLDLKGFSDLEIAQRLIEFKKKDA